MHSDDEQWMHSRLMEGRGCSEQDFDLCANMCMKPAVKTSSTLQLQHVLQRMDDGRGGGQERGARGRLK